LRHQYSRRRRLSSPRTLLLKTREIQDGRGIVQIDHHDIFLRMRPFWSGNRKRCKEIEQGEGNAMADERKCEPSSREINPAQPRGRQYKWLLSGRDCRRGCLKNQPNNCHRVTIETFTAPEGLNRPLL